MYSFILYPLAPIWQLSLFLALIELVAKSYSVRYAVCSIFQNKIAPKFRTDPPGSRNGYYNICLYVAVVWSLAHPLIWFFCFVQLTPPQAVPDLNHCHIKKNQWIKTRDISKFNLQRELFVFINSPLGISSIYALYCKCLVEKKYYKPVWLSLKI